MGFPAILCGARSVLRERNDRVRASRKLCSGTKEEGTPETGGYGSR